MFFLELLSVRFHSEKQGFRRLFRSSRRGWSLKKRLDSSGAGSTLIIMMIM